MTLLERAAHLPVIDSRTLRSLGGDPKALSVQLSRWVRQGKLVPLRRGIFLLPAGLRRSQPPLQLYLLRLMHDAGSTGDLAFIGGTALRLLQRLPRFSEDLDFCHEPLPKRAKFDAARLFDTIERGLLKAGYDVTVKAKPERTVANAFFRFQGVPREAGWSRDPHLGLSIKVEVELRPPKGAHVETTLVQRFFPVSLRHYDLASLFAGKLHAILARRWVKGRDWFDLVWYLTERKGLEPNLGLLENALKQTRTSALPREGWRAAVMRRLETLDWRAVVTDLQPFVERQRDLDVLSKEAIHKLLDDG